MKFFSFNLSWMALVFLVGCQTLSPNYEEPSLSVLSIQPLPAQGFEQPFQLGLKLTNPNSVALNLNGMTYQLSVEGHKLAQGATADIPEVPAYGEARFNVTVSTSLIGGLKLLQDVMANPRNKVSYELVAKLDVGWSWLPRVTVKEVGEINFSSR